MKKLISVLAFMLLLVSASYSYVTHMIPSGGITLETPYDIKVTNITSMDAKVSWSGPKDKEIFYIMKLETVPDSFGTNVAFQVTNPYKLAWKKPISKKPYKLDSLTIKIKAFNTKGQSNWSDSIKIIPKK